MSGGNIYLILEFSDYDFYKIGVSQNIHKRRKKLQTGNPEDLIVIKTFKSKNPFKLEKMLHMCYSKNRVNGEWFKLSMEEVKDFLQVCQKYEDTVDLLIEHNPFYAKKIKKHEIVEQKSFLSST